MGLHLRVTGCHVPYGMTYGITFHPTQVNSRTHPALTPAGRAGIRFILPAPGDGRLSWS